MVVGEDGEGEEGGTTILKKKNNDDKTYSNNIIVHCIVDTNFISLSSIVLQSMN